MISLLMTAPFKFTPDVIPEPVLRGAVRDLVEPSGVPEFLKGQSPVQPTVLVEGPVQPTVGEHAPVEADSAVRQSVERRCAVGAQAVVPARRLVQAIDRFDVIEESVPHFLRSRMEAVQVCLLIPPVLCAAQDDIAFIGGDEDQLLLPVETADNRVALSLAIPHLDR